MKPREKDVDEFVLKHLGLFKTPPQPEMNLAEARIERRLRTASPAQEPLIDVRVGTGWRTTRVVLAFGAVAAAIALTLFLRMPHGIDVPATAVSNTGSVVNVGSNKIHFPESGETIPTDELIRTSTTNGAISLGDGSRVEMRAGTELSVDRGNDGVRIHLQNGSVLVHAAKQHAGHLYVQTRDAVVSVVGTVFLVSSEEAGSRVAVFEGEVHVKQGNTTKALLAGEQLKTNSRMATTELKELITWSEKPETLAALLEQSTAPRPSPSSLGEAHVAFDVVSIRPSAPLPAGGGRGGTPRTDAAPSSPEIERVISLTAACGPGSQLEVSPGRFVLSGATVYRLIALGYGLKNCQLALQMGIISGGPEWARSERYDIQATIPAGSPSYTRQQLNDGDAAKLQQMIQTMLVERFKLTLRQDTKELPAYNLVVAKPGKIKRAEDQSPTKPVAPGTFIRLEAMPRGAMLNCAGNAIQISQVATCLQGNVSALIFDKTNLQGLYDVPRMPADVTLTPPGAALSPNYAALLLDQIGLKLEPTKAPEEVWVVQRVEKPSEN